MAYCKSQVTAPAGRDGETNAPSLPLAVSGKTDKTWPPQLEASLTLPCHAPHPLHPSNLQLIILNKIEFAPLDCCKIIKHGTGLLNRFSSPPVFVCRFWQQFRFAALPSLSRICSLYLPASLHYFWLPHI